MTTYLGLDLGTRRGALIRVAQGKITKLASWERGPAVRDPTAVLSYFERLFTPHFAANPGAVLAIDYTPYEVYIARGRRSNKLAVAVKGLLAGHIICSARQHQLIPVLVPPSVVRQALGLTSRVAKEDVHEELGYQLPNLTLANFNEHELDSICLALAAKRKIGSKLEKLRAPVELLAANENRSPTKKRSRKAKPWKRRSRKSTKVS